MTSPKMSVLCAVRNEEKFLSEMLDSLLDQSFTDWELVLVDDGSDDCSVEIAQVYSAQEPRIKHIVLGSRLGKVGAFNVAYGNCSGAVIVLVAGDDTLPPDSLDIRYRGIMSAETETYACATYKLATFSDDEAYHGMVLPRGNRTSTSGGVICINRALASQVFPIPESLPSEDIWLAEVALGLADVRIEGQHVVLNYRIHAGNSHPRQLPFKDMSKAMAERFEAYRLLAECDRFELPASARAFIVGMYAAELSRRERRILGILSQGAVPLSKRASMLAMSVPCLWGIRSRWYHFFSGRQSR